MGGLRQDDVFERGIVGAEGVHGGDAFYRGVEFFKEFIGDARGDFGAVTPTEHVFVRDDHAADFFAPSRQWRPSRKETGSAGR